MNRLFSWARGKSPASPQKKIHLALQGGGAHGAFTWGVLDELLKDGRLIIDAVSGASAGAVNAVMLVDGLIQGGAEEARKRLAGFWRAASISGHAPELQRRALERMFPAHSLASAQMKALLHTMGQFLSPTDINPLNINPLKQIIEQFVDFAALRANTDHELFISATNVRTGALRLFTRQEMSAEAVMASACLPLLFRPVEIDGVSYWDGGYTANPPLLPFLRTGEADVLIVQIYPLTRRKVPLSSSEIMSRAGEIAFNAPFLAELRALAVIEQQRGARPLRLHRVLLNELEERADTASRLNNSYEYFQMLHEIGRRAARNFLDAHFADLGGRGTLGLETQLGFAGA